MKLGFAILLCSVTLGMAQNMPTMHTVAIFPNVNPPGALVISDGIRGNMAGSWQNNTGQNIYIWGVQSDLWTNLAIPPAGSLAAAGMGAAADFIHYAQSIADLNIQVTADGVGQIFGWGSDHYENAPRLNGPPSFFPRPFQLGPGAWIYLAASGANGWQRSYGGSFTLNADALIYYTIGQP